MRKKQLILIRGPQGGGKTTLARILAEHFGCGYLEADMFFTDPLTGVYTWVPEKVRDAHEWCRGKTREALQKGETVIVSNTTISEKELRAYETIAEEEGAGLWELIAWGKFKNLHGVSENTVQAKRQAFFLNK